VLKKVQNGVFLISVLFLSSSFASKKVNGTLEDTVKNFKREFVQEVQSLAFVSSYKLIESSKSKVNGIVQEKSVFFLRSNQRSIIGDSYYVLTTTKSSCKDTGCSKATFKVLGPLEVIEENSSLVSNNYLTSSGAAQTGLQEGVQLSVDFKKLTDKDKKIYTVVEEKIKTQSERLAVYVDSLKKNKVLSNDTTVSQEMIKNKVSSLVNQIFERI